LVEHLGWYGVDLRLGVVTDFPNLSWLSHDGAIHIDDKTGEPELVNCGVQEEWMMARRFTNERHLVFSFGTKVGKVVIGLP
jgi:hypothetical protein